jgi:hypothetical protein
MLFSFLHFFLAYEGERFLLVGVSRACDVMNSGHCGKVQDEGGTAVRIGKDYLDSENRRYGCKASHKKSVIERQ